MNELNETLKKNKPQESQEKEIKLPKLKKV